MSVYLDYNASAPIDPRVIKKMVDIYQNHVGNADSRTHSFGDDARDITETARAQVATLLGVQKGEVFFTSGATESNNIAILGLQKYGIESGRKHIVTSGMEHKAVLGAAKHLEQLGFQLDIVMPGEDGRVSAEDVLSKVREDTLLVSVMHVNNETGIIQPVKEIGEALSKSKTLFHIDATQSCGKLVEEIQHLHYDMMSISAHKMHGPQGVGALILKKKRYALPPVSPIMFGGPQEHGIRPGTLPTALIAGFGYACELALSEYKEKSDISSKLRQSLLDEIRKSGVQYKINGSQEFCVPTTLNVSFLGVSSEALMLATKQYCGISNGSACTSSSYNHSHVLSSMGLSEERIESAVRISWDADADEKSFLSNFDKILDTVKQMV